MSLPRRPRTQAAPGFTLIEVMVALGILGFGLLTLALMQLQAMRGGNAGRHVSDATRLARSQMEQIQRMPFDTVEGEADNGWEPVPWLNLTGFAAGELPVQIEEAGTGTRTDQIYSVWWRVSSISGTQTLLNIELEVSWPDRHGQNDRPTRTGRPTVTLAGTRYNW